MLRTNRIVWLADTSPIHGANFFIARENMSLMNCVEQNLYSEDDGRLAGQETYDFYVTRILSILFREVRH